MYTELFYFKKVSPQELFFKNSTVSAYIYIIVFYILSNLNEGLNTSYTWL